MKKRKDILSVVREVCESIAYKKMQYQKGAITRDELDYFENTFCVVLHSLLYVVVDNYCFFSKVDNSVIENTALALLDNANEINL